MVDDDIPEIGPRQFVGWFFQPDPLLGWRMRPRQRAWYVKPDIHTWVETNVFGFRGADFALEKPQHVQRVLLLADSFGAAIEVSEEAIFARVMERALNANGAGDESRAFQVINTGVGGYGTEQELLFLQQRGAESKPDIVVLGFHFGDDLIENSLALRQAVSWRLVKLPRPYLHTDVQGQFQLRNYPPKKHQVKQTWQHYYDLLPAEYRSRPDLGLQTSRWDKAGVAYRRMLEKLKAWLLHLKQKQSFTVELMMYHPQPGALYEAAWQHTRRVIQTMQTCCANLGAQLLVAGLCAKEQVLPGYLHQRVAAAGAACAEFSPTLPNERLKTLLHALQLPFVDLTPTFADKIQQGETLFFARDLHWNPKGHQLAGEQLAETILSFKS